MTDCLNIFQLEWQSNGRCWSRLWGILECFCSAWKHGAALWNELRFKHHHSSVCDTGQCISKNCMPFLGMSHPFNKVCKMQVSLYFPQTKFWSKSKLILLIWLESIILLNGSCFLMNVCVCFHSYLCRNRKLLLSFLFKKSGLSKNLEGSLAADKWIVVTKLDQKPWLNLVVT